MRLLTPSLAPADRRDYRFIVRWKGHVPANATSTFVTGVEDWMPTLLDLAGAAGFPFPTLGKNSSAE